MNDGRFIIDKIIADADDSVKKILNDAKENAEQIIAAAQEKAAKELAKSDKAVQEEKEKIFSKQVSGAEMDAKKAILAQKQELLAEVIDEAEKRLVSLDDEKYASVIGSMLENMDKSLGTEVIVSEKDKARLADVISAKGFTLSERSADINGGIIIRNGDIEYNYSFGSIIAIEKEEIQQIAAKILFE